MDKDSGSINSAEHIFESIRGFKAPGNISETPQKLLIRYCNEVLGSIERFHVDFKEKHDRRDSILADDDKKNLAKAVSGFANSGGGVLIWGIEDKSLKPKPITDIRACVAKLLELAPHVADPNVQGIDGDLIPADRDDGDTGFGLVYIPESTLPPHRVLLNQKEIKNHYYTRTGSSFAIASHTQLQDMFGRRPKPKLKLNIKYTPPSGGGEEIRFTVILGIENEGRGVAKSPFLAVRIHKPYEISGYGIDGNGNFGLGEITNSSDQDERKYGSSAIDVIHPGVVHDVTAIEVKINPRTAPQYVYNLTIDYKFAAEGIKLTEDQIVISRHDLWSNMVGVDPIRNV